MKKSAFKIKLLISTLLIYTSGCESFLKIDPPKDQITIENVYSSDEIAQSTMRGVYAKMMSGNGFASGFIYSITLLAGRSGDDFINQNTVSTADTKRQFSTNNLLPGNTFLRQKLWQEPYQVIYAANTIIENLAKSKNITDPTKVQLNAESKFIRAFCHFYLTNLFGEIPIILTTDYTKNAVAFASTKADVYNQIISDLIDAKDHLPEQYTSIERIRPNKWAASAFLARVYLYNEDWAKAETEATEVIDKKAFYNLPSDLNKVFLKNSEESILQFAIPMKLGYNTYEGNIFVLTAAPTSTTEVTLSGELLSAFEPGDRRYLDWVGTFTNGAMSWSFPYKYKIRIGVSPLNEYSMVLRLAEQYLIRAEARINLNKTESGIADLNIIRQRSRSLPTLGVPNPLPDISLALDKADALLAVEKERRVELFSEWGHRWLDLKRINRANAVLSVVKAPNWQSTDVLYPIPVTELLNNSNLKQNPGYN